MSPTSHPSSPRVSAILVGWNSLQYLEDCLGSLGKQELPPAEVIFVDNGSTDGSQAWLEEREELPGPRLLNRYVRGLLAALQSVDFLAVFWQRKGQLLGHSGCSPIQRAWAV